MIEFLKAFVKWVIEKISSDLLESKFEFFEYGTYRVEYLIDCGAGYMKGIDEVVGASLKQVMSKYQQHDVEKVYFKDKLVYAASWADIKNLSE